MTPAELREIRRGLALNQREMADLLGLSWHMISRYERGLAEPQGPVLRLYRLLRDGTWEPALDKICPT